MGNNKSKLNPETLVRLKQRSKFTETELIHWYEGFSQDLPTGDLMYDGFQKVYKQFFPQGDAARFAEMVFGAYDSNNDGTVEFEEFIMALNVVSHGTLDEKLDWAFRLYDFNNDGLVSKRELSDIVEAVYSMVEWGFLKMELEFSEQMPIDGLNLRETAEERVDRVFELVDTDGNAHFSREEFFEGSKQDRTIVEALSIYDGLL